MAGMRTAQVDYFWAAQRGLTGELPTYDMTTNQRPAYGSAIAVPPNAKNARLIPIVLAALARIHPVKKCTNGGNHEQG